MEKPFLIELVNSSTKKRVYVCKTGPVNRWLSGDKFVTEWTPPFYNYNGTTKHRIRVSKGSIEAFSGEFTVKNKVNETTSVYEIPVTSTVNKIRSRVWKEDKDAFIMELPSQYPDPGQGKAKVGYEHYNGDGNGGAHYTNYVHRSFAFFEVSSLQGKGLVTKVSLKFNLYAGCNTFVPIVKILDDKWGGDAKALFSVEGTQVDPESFPLSRITTWANHPEQNYGIVFIGPNESLHTNGNSQCVGNFSQLKLIVEMTTF